MYKAKQLHSKRTELFIYAAWSKTASPMPRASCQGMTNPKRNRKDRVMPTKTYFESEPDGISLEHLVDRTLLRLRVNPALSGFRYLSYILVEVIQGRATTELITKDLYPKTAKHFDTRSARVERSIRTAVANSWRNGGRNELDQMAGYHLVKRPTNSEFINLAAIYIRYTQEG